MPKPSLSNKQKAMQLTVRADGICKCSLGVNMTRQFMGKVHGCQMYVKKVNIEIGKWFVGLNVGPPPKGSKKHYLYALLLKFSEKTTPKTS